MPNLTPLQAHLALAEERHGLLQLAQHAPHFAVVGGHHRGLHLAPQLNLLHQLLLPPRMLRAGLWCTCGWGGEKAAVIGGGHDEQQRGGSGASKQCIHARLQS